MEKQKKLFMGIDVSKGYADFTIIDEQKNVIENNFQLDDNSLGHKILSEKIINLSKNNILICAVENTGGYERNWVEMLKSISKKNNNIEVYKVNPKAVKHQIQSLLRTTVDDAFSAEAIAIYIANNYSNFKENWVHSISQSKEVTDGKMLHSMIQSLIKQQTMKKNQLEKLVYQSFPELLTYMRYGMPIWILKFLEKYPSASATKRAKIQGLKSIKNITELKAHDLKAKAKNSTASITTKIIELLISQQSKDIQMLEKEISMLKSELENLFKDDKRIEIITSIKGIATWSAASFLIELGDDKRFKSTSQLAGFFGVNPSFKISGDGLFRVKMSKQGSASMRAVLFTIANNLKLYDTYFRDIYAKHRARGKKHKIVMGILMHKVLRVLWGMLKTGKKFDKKIDERNIEKNQQEKTVIQISKKSRRLQELDINAPTSRANLKKRKAILESQSSNKDDNTRSSKHSLMQT